MQNGSGQLVTAQVRVESQALVGFHGVGAMVLQLVSAELVEQADAAALLMLVDEQAAALLGDALERNFKLRAAIAAQAVKHVSGEALGMNANQRRGAGGQVPHFQHDGFFGEVAIAAFESIDPEGAELRRKGRFGHFREPQPGEVIHGWISEVLLLLL